MLIGEAMEELAIAAEVAGGEHGGSHRDVLATEIDRLLDRAGRTADRRARRPRASTACARHVLHVRCEFAAVEQQQVDIGVDGHLAAGVATDGDDRDTGLDAAGRAAKWISSAMLVEAADQPVREVRVRLVDDWRPGADASLWSAFEVRTVHAPRYGFDGGCDGVLARVGLGSGRSARRACSRSGGCLAHYGLPPSVSRAVSGRPLSIWSR